MITTATYSPKLDAVTYEVRYADRRRKPYSVTLARRSHGCRAAQWRKTLQEAGWPRVAIQAWQKAFVRAREELARRRGY